LRAAAKRLDRHVELLGSGTILREVEAAAEYLADEHGVSANVWSVTSYSELRRDGIACDRWNIRNPEQPPRRSYVAECLAKMSGPFIAASDYMRIVPDQIRPWVPGPFYVLGTDGFGRSDSRRALREHFEVNRDNIVVAALKALADGGIIGKDVVAKEIDKLGLDPDKPNPVDV
jgi:pyruvate dehydrogenase E1 component